MGCTQDQDSEYSQDHRLGVPVEARHRSLMSERVSESPSALPGTVWITLQYALPETTWPGSEATQTVTGVHSVGRMATLKRPAQTFPGVTPTKSHALGSVFNMCVERLGHLPRKKRPLRARGRSCLLCHWHCHIVGPRTLRLGHVGFGYLHGGLRAPVAKFIANSCG